MAMEQVGGCGGRRVPTCGRAAANAERGDRKSLREGKEREGKHVGKK